MRYDAEPGQVRRAPAGSRSTRAKPPRSNEDMGRVLFPATAVAAATTAARQQPGPGTALTPRVETTEEYGAPAEDDLVEKGNVDLAKQPRVKNTDGTTSTVRSMSINEDGVEILIPTVAHDGSGVLSDKDAITQWHRTGKHLGKFRTPEAATSFAKRLHEAYERGEHDR